MKILIGNITSKLITDNQNLINALHDKYAFYVPGYNYVPAYRKGKWDGKKRYFKKDGTFKTGLLERIIKDIELVGCHRKDIVLSCDDPLITDQLGYEVLDVDKFEYRDYQKDGIDAAICLRRMIFESPTGSGKTLVMAGLVKTLMQYGQSKITILFNKIGLVDQTYRFFKECGIDNVGVNSGQGYIDGDIMLSTVQSIEKILDTHLMQTKVLIVDEAHEFCHGDVTIAAIESFPNAIFRIAFTATPPPEKADINGRMVLEGAFGPVYSTRSTEDLINEGILAKPTIQILNYSPSGVDQDLDYQSAYKQYIVESVERNNAILKIVELIVEKNTKSKILILVKNLEHLEKLTLLLTLANICNYTIEGSDNIEDRYKVINKFINSDKPAVIIGTNVMQTGISINEITHMINARGLEGEIPTIQAIGRGLRTTKDKKELMFFDFYDKVPYLEGHSKKRIKHYKNAGFEVNYVKQ